MKIVIAGIGTDVGKTLVSAILVKALKADYWKPIQCGNLDQSDTARVSTLVNDPSLTYHPESYRFALPASPHHAAAYEGRSIEGITRPIHKRPLVIECAGGIMVPYSNDLLQMHALKALKPLWILVSRHYLGSINHTLMSIEVLRQNRCTLLGVIFNGNASQHTESAIAIHGKAQILGRLEENPRFNDLNQAQTLINTYAKLWKPKLISSIETINASGIPIHKPS